MDFLQQYLATVAGWVVGLFTPAEWRAFVLLIGVTLAATHTIKIAWRLSKLPGGSHGHIYLASALVGFVAAASLWPTVGWWVPGIIAGPAAALVFKAGFFLVKKFSPGLADAINFERRRRNQGPPGGFPRRKDDYHA